MNFLRCLSSDLLKIKRRPVLWVHLLLPPAAAALFLLYCLIRSNSLGSMPGAFLGAIAAAFPTLIGLNCSMVADQEAEAGNFQQLLTYPSKVLPFFSIMAMLMLLGLASALLSSFVFEAGFGVFFHQTAFGPDFYLRGVLLVYASNIFIYIFHLFLSLRFSKGVSIGMGIVESMLSCLLLTGLGDGIWIFTPCSWSLRLLKPFVMSGGALPASPEVNAWLLVCCTATVLLFVFSLIWFYRWDGKKAIE